VKELTEPLEVKMGGREDGKLAGTTGNAQGLSTGVTGATGSAGGEPTRATWSIWNRQKNCALWVRGASGGNKTSAVWGKSCGLTSGKEEHERATDKEEINELET
jgi:hypothetical protein